MSSFISETERFKNHKNDVPGPGHYHEISKSKKKLLPVPEIPFKQSEPRFKEKEENLDDNKRRAMMKRYLDQK